jgi:4'-phosphopantetheinyl transferase
MPGEVSLTLARFTAADRDRWLTTATAVLSESERARLAFLPDPDMRTQHALGRALIRLAGAAGAGIPRDQVQIIVSSQGKPELAELGVSIAHSGRVVALATCSASPVGVDIEPVRGDLTAARRIIERRFAPAEIDTANQLADSAIGEWFARVWTIKEAVGKALGVGIPAALGGAVVAGERDPFRLMQSPSGPAAELWTLHELRAPDGYERMAIAVPAPEISLTEIRCLTLREFAHACA